MNTTKYFIYKDRPNKKDIEFIKNTYEVFVDANNLFKQGVKDTVNLYEIKLTHRKQQILN